MKKTASSLIVGLVAFALLLSTVPASVFAAATLNNDPLDRATLRVMNQTVSGQTNQQWTSSATASSNQVVSFAVYYHNTSGEIARNLRVRFSPKNTGTGTTHQFQAWVWGDNAPEVTGTVSVTLSGAQSLAFITNTIAWRPNQTAGAQSAFLNGQTGEEIFTTGGLLLGDIAPGWNTQGSVVLNTRVSNTASNTTTGTPPSVSLAVTPTIIYQGQSAALSWSSSNATSCTASGGWSGSKSLSGSQNVTITQSTTYTLTCTNSYGQASKSVTVVFNQTNTPTVNLTVNTSSIVSGQSATLSWTSTNASSCSTSGAWSGSKGTSGSEVVSPTGTATYSMTCTGANGSATDSRTITVSQVAGATSGLTVTKSSKNTILKQTAFVVANEAQGLDVLEYEIRVRNTGTGQNTVTLRDALPAEIFYVQGSTKVNGIDVADGLVSSTGISLGTLTPGEEKIVQFRAVVFFGVEQRLITNRAYATGSNGAAGDGSSTLQIRNRGQVAGAGTVNTGPEDTITLLLVIGLIGSIGAYATFFRMRHKGAATFGSALSDARLQYRVWEVNRKDKTAEDRHDDFFGNSYI